MIKDFQGIKILFSAYLNQDFDLMFGTADNAIHEFMQRSTSDEVSHAIYDVKRILSMKLSEEDLQNLIFQDLGACYYYSNEWTSAEFWLMHVLQMLENNFNKP